MANRPRARNISSTRTEGSAEISNQPLRRILGRASSYLVRWRPLSEILSEVGYETIFVQHHIPLLIYAPGVVAPGRKHVVGSQLDIAPTVMGLLELRALHASWGQDLLRIPEERGFAVSVAGGQIRWRDRRYLVDDGLTGARPLLCEPPVDPACQADTWPRNAEVGELLQGRLRAYLSLSLTLMYRDRVYPRRATRGPEVQQ